MNKNDDDDYDDDDDCYYLSKERNIRAFDRYHNKRAFSIGALTGIGPCYQ